MSLQTLQLIGLIAFILLLIFKSYVTVSNSAHLISGRISSFWLIVYLWFLFLLRFARYLNLTSIYNLTALSVWSIVIVTGGLVIHFVYRKEANKNMADEEVKTEEVKEEGTVEAPVEEAPKEETPATE